MHMTHRFERSSNVYNRAWLVFLDGRRRRRRRHLLDLLRRATASAATAATAVILRGGSGDADP